MAMDRSQPGSAPARSAGPFIALEIVVLSILWLIFSGKFDLLHLSYGVFSVAVVVLLTKHLMHAHTRTEENEFLNRVNWAHAITYPLWLLWQIIVANLEVAKIILGPSKNIDPTLVSFEYPIDEAIPRVVLGNSITVTPGTFTLRIRGRHFLIHSIGPVTAQGVVDGGMQHRVAKLFGYDLGTLPPAVLRDHLVESDAGPDA